MEYLNKTSEMICEDSLSIKSGLVTKVNTKAVQMCRVH